MLRRAVIETAALDLDVLVASVLTVTRLRSARCPTALTSRGLSGRREQVPGAIGAAAATLLRTTAPERAVIAGLRDEIAALPAPADVVPELAKMVAGG